MSKGFKIAALIIILFLMSAFLYNIFSGGDAGTTTITSVSEEGDPPFYVSLLVSWLPMIVVIVIYSIFLRMFKQGIGIAERIAVALEKKVDIPQSSDKQ